MSTSSLFSRPERWTLALLALSMLAFGLGCAFGEFRPKDPFKRKYTLELAQHDYTNYVRWSHYEKAAAFVDKEMRDEWRRTFPDVRDVRFTDWSSGPIELDEEKKTSTIEVTYLAFATNSVIELEVVETQEWFRDSVSNQWQVRPSFGEGYAALGAVSAKD